MDSVWPSGTGIPDCGVTVVDKGQAVPKEGREGKGCLLEESADKEVIVVL